jgi:hypothetical protein
MPSFLRTSAGTEIWPCTVTLDCPIAMEIHYPGNEIWSNLPWAKGEPANGQDLWPNPTQTGEFT